MADHPPTDRPPLWEVMRRAEASCCSDLTSTDARMIRAVRDWLGLEKDSEPREPAGYGIGSDCGEFTDQWARWHARQRLRAELTAEIDRAERGEP